MRARVVVFPVKGRNWCFSTSVLSPSVSESTATTLRDLFNKISFSNPKPLASNAELVVDFVAHKMNNAWIGLQKAPEGSFKRKIHGLGLRLLARVKPSEIFLKSIPKDITTVEVTYPSSLSPRLVRRRLRHIAMRGTIVHKNYFYGSVALLPVTSALAVLPLPNVPFFWVLFRTYSHWRARQGSELLLPLVSENRWQTHLGSVNGNATEHVVKTSPKPWLVFRPSKELEELLRHGDDGDGLTNSGLLDICKTFELNPNDVLKCKHLM